MFLKVTTTITTEIDVDTLTSSHSVNIEAEPGVPESLAKAAAIGGARSLLTALGEEVKIRVLGENVTPPE